MRGYDHHVYFVEIRHSGGLSQLIRLFYALRGHPDSKAIHILNLEDVQAVTDTSGYFKKGVTNKTRSNLQIMIVLTHYRRLPQPFDVSEKRRPRPHPQYPAHNFPGDFDQR